MCKYSDNFFFTSNNILRGFSLSIYIMSPPLHLPFPSKFYTKTATFPPFSLRKKKLMRIFAALKNNGRPFRRAAVIAQH